MLPKTLIDGYHRFLNDRFSEERERYEKLADKGQNPQVLLIGCCDSRVSPAVIFNASPGEVFTVRNVANLVPPYTENHSRYHGTSAALEYGVSYLNVKDIVILGHAACGGINMYSSRAESDFSISDFIGHWIKLLEPATHLIENAEELKEKNYKNYIRQLECASIINSMENLKTFPFIQKRMREEKLSLHGAYFSVATGELLVLNQEAKQFYPLEKDAGIAHRIFHGFAEEI